MKMHARVCAHEVLHVQVQVKYAAITKTLTIGSISTEKIFSASPARLDRQSNPRAEPSNPEP